MTLFVLYKYGFYITKIQTLHPFLRWFFPPCPSEGQLPCSVFIEHTNQRKSTFWSCVCFSKTFTHKGEMTCWQLLHNSVGEHVHQENQRSWGYFVGRAEGKKGSATPWVIVSYYYFKPQRLQTVLIHVPHEYRGE